jgi:predicted nucleotidyltransferase
LNSVREMMLQMLEAVADALGAELRQQVAFVGGCTTVLLITDEYTQESIRGTDDVDLVIHLTSTAAWYRLEETLKTKGFKNTGQDTVTCRLRLGALKVDFMPTDEKILGFSNTWFVGGLENAIDYTLPNGTPIKVFAAPWFLAAKLQAYLGRGKGDLLMSNDIEDIIALLDGREELIAETKHAPIELRRFVGEELSSLLRLTAFQDVIQSTAQDPDRETLIYERLDRLIEFGVRI